MSRHRGSPWCAIALGALLVACAAGDRGRDAGTQDGGRTDASVPSDSNAGPDAGLDAGRDAATDGGVDAGAGDGGGTGAGVSLELRASVELPDAVELSWEVDGGGALGFVVRRDGQPLLRLPATARTWRDNTATPGLVETPGAVHAQSTTDGVALSWLPSVTHAGALATYVVSAELVGGAWVASNQSSGFRAAETVVAYEVVRDGGWGATVTTTSVLDSTAPDGVVTLTFSSTVTVDDARTTVLLQADGGATFAPAPVAYQVRAVAEGGASPWSPAAVAARDPARPFELQWQRSRADSNQDFEDLPRVLGYRWFDPEPVLDEGRWYRLVIRVPQVPETALPAHHAVIHGLRSVAQGHEYPCFVRNDGVLQCVTGYGVPSPTWTADGGDFVEVANSSFVYGRRADGGVEGFWPESGAKPYTPPGSFASVGPGLWWGPVCGVLTDRSVACWDDTAPWPVPAQWAGRTARSVSGHCVLFADGGAECLDGAGGSAALTSEFLTELAIGRFGASAACGVFPDGGIWSPYPQLPAPASDTGFTSVSCGAGGICGLRADGRLVCRNNASYRNGGLPFFTTQRFRRYEVSDVTGCGLTLGGRLACHGTGCYDATDRPAGALPLAAPVAKVVRSRTFGVALLRNGELEAWGYLVPSGANMPAPDERFIDVATDDGNLCGVRLDGSLHCWPAVPSPYWLPPPAGRYRAVVGSVLGFCALGIDDRVVCFGASSATLPGEFRHIDLGRATTEALCGVTLDGGLQCNDATLLSGFPAGPWSAVAVGGWRHVCGVTTGDTMRCNERSLEISGAVRSIALDRGGGGGVCAVFTDGGVACRAPLPPAPPTLRFKRLDLYGEPARSGVCGIREDDTLTCWGHPIEGNFITF